MSEIRDELRAARMLIQDARLILRDFGFENGTLGPVSFEVLAAVCEDPGRTSRAIADRAGIDRNSANSALKGLQKGGLVKRVIKDRLAKAKGPPVYGYRPLPEGEELYGRAHAALGGPPYRRQRAA